MDVIPEREEAREDTEEEDEDDNDLSSFRQQWRRELRAPRAAARQQEDQEDDVHKQARGLFLQGAQFEENGKLFEAIRCYKRAERLVPNIEFETFDYTGRHKKKSPEKEAEKPGVAAMEEVEVVKEEEMVIQNLAQRFSRMRSTSQSSLIQPEVEDRRYHLGDLPTELLNYILKWVVSSELDLRSLESCSSVCRGLYIAARDPDIWRLACVRVWGPTVTTSNLFPGWREMFLTKPRVNYSGCYASKISYIREGERGFQDQETFRAWHVVEYHRFLRFFPGGQVAMLTSANDDPALVAKQLNTKHGCVSMGAMMGQYKIMDNALVCVLKKATDRKKAVPVLPRFRGRGRKEEVAAFEVPEQDFHLEFQIRGSKWRTLQWVNYIMVSKYSSGREQVDKFDVNNGKNYPRLQFSPVGCYHFESNCRL